MLMYICVFVLLGSVCLQSQEVKELHIDNSVTACIYNSTEAEDETESDGNEMFYTDYINKKIVMTLPDFANKFDVVPGWLQTAEADRQTCLHNVDVAIQAEKSPPEQKDAPRVSVYPMNDLEVDIFNNLICFVTGFYPIPIKLSWYKNNQLISDGVEISRYYPNDDLTFQIFSQINFMPKMGDIYSCVVEHSAISEPVSVFGSFSDLNQVWKMFGDYFQGPCLQLNYIYCI
ncbi:H-2 class II histocompatibility antigen, A-U alpha chain-like isoform X2 [Polypterus senegalus]|uniref:H-2 class II histocompatibility antigen, A-U alpha chain-like isoform X2 n=1 Tax=Polypterus senegalus TaxID=55291 RepID=UPI001963B2C4|nr:H-2 class II histocompatibility antigen, A-U alpha chain-like isoform X2 [Polypterus senegalus]